MVKLGAMDVLGGIGTMIVGFPFAPYLAVGVGGAEIVAGSGLIGAGWSKISEIIDTCKKAKDPCKK